MALERESKTRPSCWRGVQGIRETTSDWAQVGLWDTWTSKLEASSATSACTSHSLPQQQQQPKQQRLLFHCFRSELHFFVSIFFFSALFFFFFGDVRFGCGFPVHSFGFFVCLLVVLMVVESGFVVGGGDETGFGCGFHVLHVESCR